MLSLRKPSDDAIRKLLIQRAREPFSYEAVGASRAHPPEDYTVDRHSIKLGNGPEIFTAAKKAMRSWVMFRMPWIEFCWPQAALAEGTVVAVLIRALGLWSLNPSRVVYVIDEAGDRGERFGFAYGTLAGHMERGEERFMIERAHDGTVRYDLLAFSRPNHPLALITYPYVRRLQKRFALDSLQAMRAAVQKSGQDSMGTITE